MDFLIVLFFAATWMVAGVAAGITTAVKVFVPLGPPLWRHSRAGGLRTFRALSRFLRRCYIHYGVRIDVNAKCPACGYRSGRIEFSREYRKILHQCLVCRAVWGESTMVDLQVWLPNTGA